MRRGLQLLAVVVMVGRISDSICAQAHQPAEEHGVPAMPDRDCTLACVRGGATYVLVSEGRVYPLSNRDLATLQANAGKVVRLTGEMEGSTLRVSDVQPVHERGQK